MPELEKDEEGEKKPETTEASEKSGHQHHGENCCWLLYKIENIFIWKKYHELLIEDNHYIKKYFNDEWWKLWA